MVGFTQLDFSGGMNLFDSDIGIGANEYIVGFNVRNRTVNINTIKDAERDTTAPVVSPGGKMQGLYAFDVYLILFCSGSAYYKNIQIDSAWTQISGFSMSTTADRIYTEAVPQSVINNTRLLNSEDKINGTQLDTAITITPTIIPGTVGGLVCQDGVNQPYIILPNGSARQLQTYQQWTISAREYVPVMKQMRFINGILIGVAPDGVTIYRSVSGRPLDFVVNVTVSGDKGGDAKSTSYSVSPFQVTCLGAINSGQLFVGTLKSCHPIDFNYEATIFGEPTFINNKAISVGVINHFSFIDVTGDYTFIDTDGLRSFNAVINLQNEGRQSIFSSKIIRALLNTDGSLIKQDSSTCCAIVFDNYSLYSIKTIYGQVIGVYDNTRQVWVSFDQLDVDGTIIQFAVADQSENPTIYALTSTSVYRLYKSSASATASILLIAKISGASTVRLKCESIYGVFDSGDTNTTATISVSVDNRPQVSLEQPISGDGFVDVVCYNFVNLTSQGFKILPTISWSNAAQLQMVQAIYNEVSSKVDVKQAGRAYI